MPREENPLLILLPYSPTLLCFQHKRQALYGHPLYIVAVHCSNLALLQNYSVHWNTDRRSHSSWVTFKDYQNTMLPPWWDIWSTMNWKRYATNRSRPNQGTVSVFTWTDWGRTQSTARTTGIQARFEAGTTRIQVYSVTATLTCLEIRQKCMHGLVTWCPVLTCLMRWNTTLN
jgi:hypothetical protein